MMLEGEDEFPFQFGMIFRFQPLVFGGGGFQQTGIHIEFFPEVDFETTARIVFWWRDLTSRQISSWGPRGIGNLRSADRNLGVAP